MFFEEGVKRIVLCHNLGENGAIAQLEERLICIQEVVGSIPSGSTSASACKKGHLRFQI
jgi:hypothetical protein